MTPNKAESRRDLAWLAGALLCGLAYAVLALRSQAYGEATLSDLATTCGVAFATCAALYVYYLRADRDPPLAGVLVASAVFHGIGVLGFPVLEDDFFRYLWDGWVFAETGSPYGVAPAAYFTSETLPASFEVILDGVNHPELPTIYGPVCQWIFRAAYALAPGQVWPLQLAFGAASFGLVLVVAGMTRPRSLLLLAWSPLLIKEFAFSAHTDVLAVLALIAACRVRESNRVAAGVLLAIAAATKVFALPLVPFILLRSGRGWGAFAVTVVALHAPFAATYLPIGESSLWAMASAWRFNAPLYEMGSRILPDAVVRLTLAAAFASIWAALLLAALRRDPWSPPRGDWIYAALLLCSPALNPWYFVWVLAFAAITPSAWAWVASGSLLVSYAHGLNLRAADLGAYEIPVWAYALEFVPILAALLLAGTGVQRQLFRRSE